MKKLKKFFAAMVAMVMAFAMGVTVYAADITITNGANGSEYAAYKLLNATDGGDGKFAYTLNDKYASALKEVTGKTDDKEVIFQNLMQMASVHLQMQYLQKSRH